MFEFQARIETIKQEKESTAESMLRTQFKMELIVYTQDSTYSSSLSQSKRDEADEDEEQSTFAAHRCIVYSMDNNATLREMMLHLKSYYKVSLDLEAWFVVHVTCRLWRHTVVFVKWSLTFFISNCLCASFRLPVSAWRTRSLWWSATWCCRSLLPSCRGRCCRCFRTRRTLSSCWRRILTCAAREQLCRVASSGWGRPAPTWWSSREEQCLAV